MAHLRIAFRIFILMVLLTGLVYPLLVTGISELIMPAKAQGSIVYKDGRPVGSALIGQNFSSPKYFWPRPSAIHYEPLTPSGGSNLGPTSQKLQQLVQDNLKKWHGTENDVPSDLVYASGSGLDPHISVEGAYFQVERVARARSMDPKDLKAFLDNFVAQYGHHIVNVLIINEALDQKFSDKKL